MATSRVPDSSRMVCGHCATCSCPGRKPPDSDSDEDSNITSIVSPGISHGNYDPEVWSINGSIITDSSDVSVDDIALSGVGLSVGKAIFALGKMELRGVEWLWTRYRRAIIQRALSGELRHLKKGTDRMLDDLVAFHQDDIYGWSLVRWSRDTLLNRVRLGLGHEVVRALHRAPATLGMHALGRIYFLLDDVELHEHPIDAMVQITDGWFRYADKMDSLTFHPDPAMMSSIFTHAIIFGSDEQQLYVHLRGSIQMNYSILYRYATYSSPTGEIASRIPQRVEYLLGRDHPHYIGLEYLIRKNQLRHGIHGDALRRHALSTCLRLLRLHSYESPEESEDPWPVDLVYELALALWHQGRWTEEEVFWRFYIAVNAHAYQVLNQAHKLWSAFWCLGNNLRNQGRRSEEDQCRKFNDPLQVIFNLSLSPITPPKKVRRLSCIRRLCRLRRSHNVAARDEGRPQTEDLQKLFAEFNPQNDAFLRNIAAGLDEETQENLWELTEDKRSSNDEDFYTAHECSSDCEHDHGSEDEGGEHDQQVDDDDEDSGVGSDERIVEKAFENDADNAAESADVKGADDKNEQIQ